MIKSGDLFKDLMGQATSAQHRNDWPAALEAWEKLSTEFPDRPAAHVGLGVALQILKRFDEADDVFIHALDRFPDYAGLYIEFARVAHRRADWPEALKRWEAAMQRLPDNPDAVAGAGTTLQIMQRFDEADALLVSALETFPKHSGVSIEYARVAHRRFDWEDAIRRYYQTIDKFPNLPEAFLGASMSLLKLNRLDEMDKLLSVAVDQFPAHAQIAIDYARVAEMRNDLSEARYRWDMAFRRFPDNKTVKEGVNAIGFLLRMEALDEDADRNKSSAGSSVTQSTTEQYDLMMQFESLGSGCEFGLVQRHYGAEPLGLLRWGAIPARALVRALDLKFAGIGEADDVELFPFGDGKEYFFRDKKYSMEMHTFIPTLGSDYQKVFEQQCGRIKFLRRKLIEDLQSPEEFCKILVYKHHNGRISDDEAIAIHQALGRYGGHTLLCVRPSDEVHSSGHVDTLRPGLIMAYIDGLSKTNNARTVNYDAWRIVCAKAVQIWHQEKKHENFLGGQICRNSESNPRESSSV
jgi:tetratricopeptide (TPR) repeat protein